MENQSEYIEDLRIIKKVMEESSRFLSLSGLSGIFTGLIAIAGAAIAVFVFLDGRLILSDDFFKSYTAPEVNLLKINLIVLAVSVLVLALVISIWFSWRKSVKMGLRMWTPVSRRFLANLIVPLITGGILIIIIFIHQQWQLVLPSMLIFYGLALVSATKFTYNDIFYLGLIEIVSGLVAAALPAYGIIIWSFGFGLLHIAYGLMMYRKYER
jgi:hypothetical protein